MAVDDLAASAGSNRVGWHSLDVGSSTDGRAFCKRGGRQEMSARRCRKEEIEGLVKQKGGRGLVRAGTVLLSPLCHGKQTVSLPSPGSPVASKARECKSEGIERVWCGLDTKSLISVCFGKRKSPRFTISLVFSSTGPLGVRGLTIPAHHACLAPLPCFRNVESFLIKYSVRRIPARLGCAPSGPPHFPPIDWQRIGRGDVVSPNWNQAVVG